MNVDVEAALKNIVRIGKISSVDSAARTARVIFEDKKDADGNPLISGALKIIKNQNVSVGEYVLCIFLVNGNGDGFVIGGYG